MFRKFTQMSLLPVVISNTCICIQYSEFVLKKLNTTVPSCKVLKINSNCNFVNIFKNTVFACIFQTEVCCLSKQISGH